jgi:asparagine synthetase B (glutamine-hydrolysing)
MLHRYLDSGVEGLSEISGSFCVAWWDEQAQHLVLANDKIGHRLLFYGCRNGVFVFASQLARMMAPGLMSTKIDVEGFAHLLTYDYILGEQTLFKDIKILPPASVLTYKEGQISVKRYWHIGQLEPYGKYDKKRQEELGALFKQAVRRAIRPDLNIALDLTGGFNSRCVLAAAAAMRLPCVAHTVGRPDSTDMVLAQQAAAVAGVEHVCEPVCRDKVAEWLVPAVRYQGGLHATLHSHICQRLDLPSPFDAFVQGAGIKRFRNMWVARQGLPTDTWADMQRLLKKRMSSSTAKRVDLGGLWRTEYQTVGLEAPTEHLEHLLNQYKTGREPVTVLDGISLHEQCRKLLHQTTSIVRAGGEIYYPCLDHEFIVALAHLPTSTRMTSKIQLDLIKRFFPSLLGVRIATTLFPISYSPARMWVTNSYWGIKRKIARQFGLPDHVPTRIPSFYYDQRTRNEMRPILTELLYDPGAASRAYLRWDAVKALLDQHFSGKENWEHLVAALSVLEIVHRLWVDPAGDSRVNYTGRLM